MSLKRQKSNSVIDAYIVACEVPVQPILERLREIIRKEAPGSTEKMSYGMPAFYLHENLVHFALAKRHIGFHPSPFGVQAVQSELGGFQWSNGAIQFPLDQNRSRKISSVPSCSSVCMKYTPSTNGREGLDNHDAS